MNTFNDIVGNYKQKLVNALDSSSMQRVEALCMAIFEAWKSGRKLFICGNGGSAANAIHLANDFIYGAGKHHGTGINVEALTANASVLTCLANDEGYEHIFSKQLEVKAAREDVLIVLSGSGNSPNLIRALETGNSLGMQTYAVLGFSGGRCKELVQHAIHFEVNDMQISEDTQVIVGHLCMQWLSLQKFDAPRNYI